MMRVIIITAIFLLSQSVSVTAQMPKKQINIETKDVYKYSIEELKNLSILDKVKEVQHKKLLSPDFQERAGAAYFFGEKLKDEELDEKVISDAIALFKNELQKRVEMFKQVRKLGHADLLSPDLAYLNSEDYGMYHIHLCMIARKDSYYFEDSPTTVEKDVPSGGKVVRYPVRSEAEKALKKIKGKQ